MSATPFFRSAALGRALGFRNVWLKNDGLNPSGSLKDRASFLVVAEANRLQEDTVVTASTGNAASALAAVCAAAGKRALIFVPENAPKAKLVQMILCGACVVPVRGTYDDAFRLSLAYTAGHGGLNRNTAYHPLTIEGKKTVGLEIWQQNGWRVPDAIVVPVGDGVILAGVFKAFQDLRAAGLISRLPRLVCVQAEKSNAIHRYITTGRYRNALHPATIADSISVSVPSNAHLAKARGGRERRLFAHGVRPGDPGGPAHPGGEDRRVRGAGRRRDRGGAAEAARRGAAQAPRRRSSCSSPATGSRTWTRP